MCYLICFDTLLLANYSSVSRMYLSRTDRFPLVVRIVIVAVIDVVDVSRAVQS